MVMNVGAGNSRLSEEMFEDGFTNITNVDISYDLSFFLSIQKYQFAEFVCA